MLCANVYLPLFLPFILQIYKSISTVSVPTMKEEQPVEDIVLKNDMQPHPEGGFFKETYRSDTRVHVTQDDGSIIERSAATAIMFLITGSNVSRLHRIKSDEIWHFYGGAPLVVVEMDSSTLQITHTRIGPNVLEGEVVQYVVPAGKCFGSYSEDTYSFVGCTVSPGFEFSDFELASSEQLRGIFSAVPAAQAIIDKLCVGL
jgi:predicted cupin superfamily sugar epimerase